jgi:hypothetical protein
MAVNLSPVGGVAAQFFDNNGVILSGGKIYTYAAGTTTNQTTYTSSSGNTAHTNPIVLNAAGRVSGSGEIWLTDQVSYKFVIRTSADVLIGTYDNIVGINNTPDASQIEFTQAGTGAVQRTVQDKLEEIPSVKDFGAVGDGVTNDTAAFQAAEAAYDFLYLPEGSYLVTQAPTKTYLGPGDILTSGVSAITFVGGGANDATVTGNYDGAYPLQVVARITNPATAAVATTGFSASLGIGTLTFAGGGTYPVGSWVEIAGVSVSLGSINGKRFVLTSAAGQITFYTTATGSQTVAGTVQDYDEFELSFDGGVVFTQTYQSYDPFTDNDKSVRYTVNTYASPITLPVIPTRIFGFVGLNIQWATSRGHSAGASWAFTLTAKAEKLFTYGNAVFLNGVRALTVGSNRSIGIGPNVFGNFNSIGVENIGIGINALKDNTTGYQNIGISSDALTNNETGGANIAIGGSALHDNFAGFDNIAIGLYSQYTTTGDNNVSVGVDSLRQNKTGDYNVAVGTQAMYSVEGGLENTAVGYWALRGGTDTFPIGITNTYCTAVGVRALQLTQNASFETGVGHEALYNSKGGNNTAIGAAAGFRNTVGGYNIFVGHHSGVNASQKANGLYQIAIGVGAYTTGDFGIAIGQGVSAGTTEIVIGGPGYSTFRNGADNNASCGAASFRWSVVYAATGTINTSDEREKQQIKPIDEAALRAWAKVEYCQYKFNDAVEKKGDNARWHFGLVAQRVKEAFESEGLNAFDYGVLCYDEWKSEYEDITVEKTRQVFVGDQVYDEKYWEPTGEKKLVKAAGNRYGIRYEEALALECAYLRSKLSK